MQIDKKDKYILITTKDDTFKSFYKSILKCVNQFTKEHLILEVSNFINLNKEDFLLLLEIALQKKENGTSFVVVNKSVNIDELPEELNVVPTLLEAEDILEMEAIERELGF